MVDFVIGDVTVPNVVGAAQAAATDTLTAEYFTVVTVLGSSSTVASGLVISQSPAAGALAAGGSAVTITVSTGVGLLGATAVTFSPVGVLKGTGRLIGAVTVAFSVAVTLSGGGFMTGAATATFTASALLKAAGALTGTLTTWRFTPSGALAGGLNPIAGAASFAFTPTALFTGSGTVGAASAAFAFSLTATFDVVMTGPSVGRVSTERILFSR